LKLHALVNIYNDRTFLGACLEGLKGNVDNIIVADGAYQQYLETYKKEHPAAQPYSTDGSLEILKAFTDLPPVTILTNGQAPWVNQCVKRTALLDAVPDGDWFLIIDADEQINGDFAEGMEAIYDSGCIAGRFSMFNVGNFSDRYEYLWHPRTFKKLKGMHYKGTHWHLRDGFGRIVEEKYPVHFTEKFVLLHYKAFKTQSRLAPHQEYMLQKAGHGWLEHGNGE